MKQLILLGVLSLSLALSSAFAQAADAADVGIKDTCPNCTPPTKPVCFNLMCHYESDGPTDKSCTASSTFIKNVTIDGGEVVDDSASPNNPTFEVSCDATTIYNNSSYRYTDLLGTRIQGQEGPDPALLLPRGELHSAAAGTNGGHYSDSILELSGPDGFHRVHGQCFIWTGNP